MQLGTCGDVFDFYAFVTWSCRQRHYVFRLSHLSLCLFVQCPHIVLSQTAWTFSIKLTGNIYKPILMIWLDYECHGRSRHKYIVLKASSLVGMQSPHFCGTPKSGV